MTKMVPLFRFPNVFLVSLKNLLNFAYFSTIFCLFVLLFGMERGHNYVENFMLLSVVLGFINYLATGEYNKIEKSILLSMIFYSLVIFLSAILHGDLVRLAKGFLFTPFFMIFAPHPKKIKCFIIFSLFVGSILLSYITINQYFSGITRPDGHTNAILYSQALFIFFLFNIYFIIKNKKHLKILLIPCSIMLLVSIVLTQTRGVWLTLLIISFVTMFFRYRKDFVKIAFGFTSIIVISSLMYSNNQIVNSKISAAISDMKSIEQNNYNTSWGLRLLAWKSAKIDIEDNFFLGVGLDNFQKNKVIQVQNNQISPQIINANLQHTHNQYIQNFLIRGLPGFIALIFLLSSTCFVKNRKNFIFIGLINLSYAIFSLSDVPFEHLNTSYLYLTSIAIIYLYLLEKTPTSNSPRPLKSNSIGSI